jgi:hypothetical protein
MAITLRTRILVWAMADGESTSFVFDLFKSQFWIGTAQPSGFGGHSPNFFTEKAATLPSGVVVIDGAESASLLNTMITVNVPVEPEGHVYRVTLDLLFDHANSASPNAPKASCCAFLYCTAYGLA